MSSERFALMKFYYNEMEFEVPDGVYYPREDSELLARCIEKLGIRNKKVLEMGCGCGFIAALMAKDNEVTAADIDEEAVDTAKKNAAANSVRIEAIVSDLFASITGVYDIIIFNPPYLPPSKEDKYSKRHARQWSGGLVLIDKFAAGARTHLAKGSCIYLVISSVTGEHEIMEMLQAYGYETRIIAREKIPWEELIAIEARI